MRNPIAKRMRSSSGNPFSMKVQRDRKKNIFVKKKIGKTIMFINLTPIRLPLEMNISILQLNQAVKLHE